MLRRNPWLALLLVCGCLWPARAALRSKDAIFPQVTGYNLDKQEVKFPAGMQGRMNLLILSFVPEQQPEADSWMPAAQALQHLNFDFRYYELPIFGNENFVFRWWDVSSLRSDKTDPESWRWVVPLFVNKQKFLRSLQIPNQKQVVVLLVDRQGKVLWRASGTFTETKRDGLVRAANSH